MIELALLGQLVKLSIQGGRQRPFSFSTILLKKVPDSSIYSLRNDTDCINIFSAYNKVYLDLKRKLNEAFRDQIYFSSE